MSPLSVAARPKPAPAAGAQKDERTSPCGDTLPRRTRGVTLGASQPDDCHRAHSLAARPGGLCAVLSIACRLGAGPAFALGFTYAAVPAEHVASNGRGKHWRIPPVAYSLRSALFQLILKPTNAARRPTDSRTASARHCSQCERPPMKAVLARQNEHEHCSAQLRCCWPALERSKNTQVTHPRVRSR